MTDGQDLAAGCGGTAGPAETRRGRGAGGPGGRGRGGDCAARGGPRHRRRQGVLRHLESRGRRASPLAGDRDPQPVGEAVTSRRRPGPWGNGLRSDPPRPSVWRATRRSRAPTKRGVDPSACGKYSIEPMIRGGSRTTSDGRRRGQPCAPQNLFDQSKEG